MELPRLSGGCKLLIAISLEQPFRRSILSERGWGGDEKNSPPRATIPRPSVIKRYVASADVFVKAGNSNEQTKREGYSTSYGNYAERVLFASSCSRFRSSLGPASSRAKRRYVAAPTKGANIIANIPRVEA